MRQKKSTKIIFIVMILLVIFILLVGIAYAYFATDMFKSNKELFFKYITQIGNEEEGLMDKQLMEYFEKKKVTPYTDEGTFLVNITSEKDQEQFEGINNFNLSFSGQVDTVNSKVKQNISLNYSDTVNFPFTYQRVSNIIGIQTKYINDKLIAIDTSDLGDFMGEASDFIGEIFNYTENLQELTQTLLTDEQKGQIQDTYFEVFKQQLEDNQFSKATDGNNKGYKLTLTREEVNNLLVQLLETLKNDQTTLDKLNDYLKVQKNSAKITTSDIEKAIENIQNNSDLLEETIEITVYSNNGKISQLEIKTQEGTIKIEKTTQNNQLILSVSYEMTAENPSKISLVATLEGLETMQNVEENYQLELIGEVSYQYQFNNNINFIETVDIEEFTEENSLLLNDYDEETVADFLGAVVERLMQVNQKQMEELGLEEDENPLQYIIPQFEIYSLGFDATNTNNISEEEVNAFNSKFENYESTNLQGVTVKGLLSTIQLNNEAQENDNLKIKEIHFDGDEYEATDQNIILIKSSIETQTAYRVEFERDEDTALIYRVVINKK